MPEHDQNTPRDQRRNSTPSLPWPVLIIVILLVLGGVGLLFFPSAKQGTGPETANTAKPASEEQTEATTTVTATVSTPAPAETTPATDMAPAPVTGIDEFEPGMSPPTEPEQLRLLCSRTADRLQAFFKHVDQQDYIGRFQLNEPSQAYFTALAYRLLDNPPVVSRESDDLYTILRNMAHFFRIIGKDNIILLKTILDRERDKIEDVAMEIYFWSSNGECKDERFSFDPTLEKMYEYAGFFLNTMGGRSYLFRRDSRSRLLVNYYSILLIDQANAMGVNRHGIDISLIIPQLMREIESSNQLIYKENYLDRLGELLEKYPAPDSVE